MNGLLKLIKEYCSWGILPIKYLVDFHANNQQVAFEIAKYLIPKGVTTKPVDDILTDSVLINALDLFKILVNYGANVNGYRSNLGRYATRPLLMLAFFVNKNYRMYKEKIWDEKPMIEVIYLLSKGANPKLKNGEGLDFYSYMDNKYGELLIKVYNKYILDQISSVTNIDMNSGGIIFDYMRERYGITIL